MSATTTATTTSTASTASTTAAMHDAPPLYVAEVRELTAIVHDLRENEGGPDIEYIVICNIVEVA